MEGFVKELALSPSAKNQPRWGKKVEKWNTIANFSEFFKGKKSCKHEHFARSWERFLLITLGFGVNTTHFQQMEYGGWYLSGRLKRKSPTEKQSYLLMGTNLGEIRVEKTQIFGWAFFVVVVVVVKSILHFAFLVATRTRFVSHCGHVNYIKKYLKAKTRIMKTQILHHARI